MHERDARFHSHWNYNGEDSAAAPTIEYFKRSLRDYLAK